MKEVIKHAACKATNGMILLGKCHADCFYQARNIGLKIQKKSSAQGFYTNKGRYVDRIQAAIIAKKAKQLDPNDKRKVVALLSEDIWYQQDRYIYVQTRGYVETLK
jgi:lactam utilization protein B